MYKRRLDFISDSVQGKNRNTNKDGVVILSDENYHILGVFDGVSSAIGAKEAVNYSIDYITKNHGIFYKKGTYNLSELISKLNQSLCSTGINEPYSTCSIICIPSNPKLSMKLVSLGDSRVYSISKQYSLQLTTDDNDEVAKNILTKYLGTNSSESNDFEEINFFENGKKIFICTDGFYSIIEDNYKNISELHRLLNLKKNYYIQKGIKKVICDLNDDDASYVFVRWENV